MDTWATELQIKDLGYISGVGNNKQGTGEERGQEEEEEKVQAEREEVSRNCLNQKKSWEHADIPTMKAQSRNQEETM